MRWLEHEGQRPLGREEAEQHLSGACAISYPLQSRNGPAPLGKPARLC
jgi:hypothetical protein